ncbi:MAG TPA: DNA mismatch repair protein [Polyangiaceae bacterium]|nr:DNA mismatch repair protein [Polyangiaceae bacterium]
MTVSTMPVIPDILQPTPARRIDLAHTKLALTLALASGSAGGVFAEALDAARIPASTFRPSEFASELFLQRFVAQGLRVKIAGQEPVLHTKHLFRLLSEPPSDPEVATYRRQILFELTNRPELRQALEQSYVDLCQLRGLLENPGGVRVWDESRRRLDILRVFKSLLDRLADGFAHSESGLRRLAEFGVQVRQSEPYTALRDLLEFDARKASVDVRLAVGADGSVNGFELLSVKEQQDNPFVLPVWRRWLAKLELFVRGYRFSDGEILARLVDAVISGLEDELASMVQLLGDLEFYLGALGFRDAAEAAGLAVCLPEFVEPSAPRELRRLFNPLLLVSGIVPVPSDLTSARLASTTLVTGPNSGGKTRLLQSLGLTQLLAQNGLFVPAASARIAWATGLVASLIEEARADQSEGRLGMELMRIRELFERLRPGSLVLLDELCSGTNPAEGEQIFELVITMMSQLEPQAFITTHFLAFANRLAQSRSIEHLAFLQVELDAQRRPTYQFAPGVAGSSLAAHTAERLGVTGEQLSALIQRNLRVRQVGGS